MAIIRALIAVRKMEAMARKSGNVKLADAMRAERAAVMSTIFFGD
jgi:hypothetical protein